MTTQPPLSTDPPGSLRDSQLFSSIAAEALDAVRPEHVLRLQFPPPIESAFKQFYESMARDWVRSMAGLVTVALGAWFVVAPLVPPSALPSAPPWAEMALLALLALAAALTYRRARGEANIGGAQRVLTLVLVPAALIGAWLRLSAGDTVGGMLPLFMARLVIPLVLRLRLMDTLPAAIVLTVAAHVVPMLVIGVSPTYLLPESIVLLALALAVQYLLERDQRQDFYQRAQIYQLATLDALTGAFNRASFIERAEVEIERGRRASRVTSLLLFDVDFFKQVNDTHGHAAGDTVLCMIVAIARDSLRPSDLVGRIGGEEFAVLLPEIELATAGQVAERLRERIAGLRVIWGGQEITTTISVGVVEATASDTLLTLLHRSDINLYYAKANGRNKVISEIARANGGGTQGA